MLRPSQRESFKIKERLESVSQTKVHQKVRMFFSVLCSEGQIAQRMRQWVAKKIYMRKSKFLPFSLMHTFLFRRKKELKLQKYP